MYLILGDPSKTAAVFEKQSIHNVLISTFYPIDLYLLKHILIFVTVKIIHVNCKTKRLKSDY